MASVNPYEDVEDQLAAPQAQVAPPDPAAPVGQQPAPAAPANPYDDVENQASAQQKERDKFTAWRATRPGVEPGKAADVLRFSAASGLGPEFVEQHLDEVKQKTSQEQVEQALSARPGIAQWMSEDPQKAALARDDLHPLSAVEFWLTGRNEYKTTDLGNGSKSMEYLGHTQPGVVEALGRGAANIYRGLQKLAVATQGQAAPGGAWEAESQRQVAAMQEDIKSVDLWNQQAAQREEGQGLVRTGVTKLAGFVPTAMSMAVVGPGAVIPYLTAVGAGDSIDAMRNLKDAEGNPLLSETEAKAWGLGTSAASSALSVALGNAFVGGLSKAGTSITNRVVGDAVAKVLSTTTIGQLRARGAAIAATHVASGMAMMAAQMGAEAGSQELARVAHGQEADWDKVGNAIVDGMKEGAWLAPFAVWGAGREYLGNVGKLAELKLYQERLDGAAKAAQESSLVKTHPEIASELFGRLAQESPTVYVDRQAWDKMAASKSVDPAQFASRVIGDDGQAYGASTATGDVAVPMDKYLTQIARNGLHEGLRDDVRLNQEGQTPRQAADAAKSLKDRSKSLEALDPAGMDASHRLVYDDYRSKAEAAGQKPEIADAVARQVAAFYKAQAELIGTKPDELYRRTGVSIVSGGEPEAGAQILSQGGKVVPAASRLLSRRHLSMSPEERAREHFIDSNTGILNEHGFKALTPDPERPMVGHISVEGTKWVNDNAEGGHEAGDRLYRMAAKALHGIDPEAAKVGGDFAVRVRDEAHLQDIVQQLNEAMPVKGFSATGAAGETFKAAGDAHIEAKQALEQSGARAARGAKPLGVEAKDAADLTFPEETAAAKVPASLVEQHSARPDAESFRAAYTEPETGLLSSTGWNNIPRKAHLASIDLNGLKHLNSELGTEGGDEALKAFGVLARLAGGHEFDVSHLHGDEYAAQSNDPEALAAYLDKLALMSDNVRIQVAGPDGTVKEIQGLSFGRGIGGSNVEAEAALNIHKQELSAAGKRGSAADARRVRDAGQEQDRGDVAGRGSDLDRGGATLSAGEGSQDFAGPEQAPEVARAGGRSLVLAQRGARGYIEFESPEAGKVRGFNIHLLETADASTLAHETAHFLGQVFFDLAGEAGAPEGMKADADALAKWMGYGSAEGRTQIDIPNEEKLASGWEQYLAEGKSPSVELTPVFARFKGWMLNAYRGIQAIGDFYKARFKRPLALSDDVRQVFDRWLTAEPAIDQVRGRGGNPLEAADLKPGERARDSEAETLAREYSQQALVAQLASEQRKSDDAFFRGEQEKIQGQIQKEVDQERPYQALEYFRAGKHPAQDMLGGMKLDRAAVKDRYGVEFAKTLPRDLWAPKGLGLAPDDMAAQLGYGSGHEMIRELQAVEPRDQRIARLTGERMAEQYPTLLNSPELVADQALDGIHNAREAALVLSRLRTFVGKLVPEMAQEVKLLGNGGAQELAARLVSEKKIGELSTASILQTERAAAREAYEMATAGKHRQAADAMVRQLLAQHMYGEAKAAKHHADVLQGALERGDTPGIQQRLAKAGQPYADVVTSLLEGAGLKDPGDSSKRVGLDALLSKMDTDAQSPDFDVDELRAYLNKPVPWSGLTMPEAENIHDAVQNLRAIAKNLNEIEVEGKRIDRKAVIAKIAEESSRLPLQPAPAADLSVKTPVADALLSVQAWDSALLRSKIPIDWLGDTAHKAIWDRYIDSRNKADELSKRVQAKINDAWENLPKEMQAQRYDQIDAKDLPLEGQKGPRTREWLWMLTLNAGNEGNMQRLADGYRWDEGQVRDFIKKNLTPEEGRFLQSAILDTFDHELWPEIEAKEKRVRGSAPAKVQAKGIEMADGTFLRGGYFPAKADPRTSGIGQAQATEADIKALSDFYGSEYERAATARSHTKARAKQADYKVNLQWSVIPSHISQVIHDIAYDEMVRDVGQLMLDPDMQQVAQQRIGVERAKGMLQWLRTVANSQAESIPGTLGKLFQGVGNVQNRLVQASIVGSVPVAMSQFAHPLVAWASGDISARHTVPAMIKALSPEMRQQAISLSPELQHRVGESTASMMEDLNKAWHGEARNLRGLLSEIGPAGNRRLLGTAVDRAQRIGAVVMDTADRLVSTCIWMSAYDEAIAKNDPDAVKTADNKLNNVMPPRDAAEKSPFLRSPVFSKLLMFHGFFNTMYGLERRIAHESMLDWADADSASEYAKAGGGSAIAAGRMMGVIAFGVIAGEYIMGHGKEDDETAGEFAARRAIAAPFSIFPFVGAPIDQLAKKAITGKAGDVSVRQAPALAQLEHVFKSIDKAMSEDNRTDEDKLFGALDAVSTSLGLPARQPLRTGKYVYDLATGKANPRGPGDVASGLVYGERENQPGNPARDLQGLTE